MPATIFRNSVRERHVTRSRPIMTALRERGPLRFDDLFEIARDLHLVYKGYPGRHQLRQTLESLRRVGAVRRADGLVHATETDTRVSRRRRSNSSRVAA